MPYDTSDLCGIAHDFCVGIHALKIGKGHSPSRTIFKSCPGIEFCHEEQRIR